MTEILAGLVRDGQRQGVFCDTHSADGAGAMIATYFFRVCVLECALGSGPARIGPCKPAPLVRAAIRPTSGG